MSNTIRFSFAVAVLLAGIARAPLGAQTAAPMPVADAFNALHFRSVGPAVMSGRLSDIAVYEANSNIFYVGSAHGGVWKTINNGTTFTPLLQDEGLLSIGALTVSQTNPDLLWVGTGEANNRQSTSWGDGIYKTTDGGRTFQNMGLRDSKHINRIIIDPMDNDVVLVAAVGPLFGPGGDRGVYKTTDGGRTWKLVLSGDENTGANDLVRSHTNPNILFASLYQRRRTACCVNGGGPGSGIWKSTDGGDHWTKLSGNGLPAGPLGRIALDVYRQSSNIVFALIEGASAGRGGEGGGRAATTGETGLYRSDDGGQSWHQVNHIDPRALYFSQLRIDPKTPDRIFTGGGGLNMSIDGGVTVETNADRAIHSDHHLIWLDPNTPGHIIVGEDGGLAISYDMSRTWQFIPNLPVGLFYHVNYDMEIPYNVCGGMQDNADWCGPSASRHSHGIMNYDWIEIEGGDGFVAFPDRRDGRIVFSEAQDGNMIRHNKVTGESKSIRPIPANVTPAPAKGDTYRFNWDTPLISSPNDPGTILTAANKVFKSSDGGDSWTVISPDLTTNANRDTIVTMGTRNSDIKISRNDGITAWSTIVSLAESPRQAGVYYAGSDDGVLSVSRDGGKSWQNVTKNVPGFPAGGWVSKVAPSQYEAGTVYVTVDNHRLNDYEPHIWVSTDFGATFRSLNANLKGENARTITEDQKNPDVLYLGTESGLFVTLDRGKSWRRLRANFPNVRVDEITLHPRDNAMLVATHGRDIWILDHLAPIQEYAAAQASEAKLFSVPTTLEWKPMDNRNDEFWGQQYFVGENPPLDAVIQFSLKKPVSGLTIRVRDGAGITVREIAVPANRNEAGIQTICWDLRGEPNPSEPAPDAGRGGRGAPPAVPGVPQPEPEVGYKAWDACGPPVGVGGTGFFDEIAANAAPYVVPGTYTVVLAAGDRTLDTKPLRIIMDPAVKLTDSDRRRHDAVANDLHSVQRTGLKVAAALDKLYPQVTAATGKIKDAGNVPAAVKTQFEALAKQFDSVRVKFGVPTVAGRGGGGGAVGRGGADPDDALTRTTALKIRVMGIWEAPSDGTVRQAAEAKSALQKAIADANAFFTRAAAMSASLKTYDVVLTVPEPIK